MRPARCLILLLCLCALALRAGGAHVHVGLDHQDVHPEDSQNHVHMVAPDLHGELHPDDHHHQHDADDHDDAVGHQQHMVVDLDGQALSKKPSADPALDELLFAATLILLLLAPGKLILSSTHLIAPPLQRLIHLRPPLRGPPLRT